MDQDTCVQAYRLPGKTVALPTRVAEPVKAGAEIVVDTVTLIVPADTAPPVMVVKTPSSPPAQQEPTVVADPQTLVPTVTYSAAQGPQTVALPVAPIPAVTASTPTATDTPNEAI
jgi:hypothetical protein